jgi:hypothetical protein
MTIGYIGTVEEAETDVANAAALEAVTTSTLPNGAIAYVTALGAFKLDNTSTLTPNGTTIISALNGGNWKFFPRISLIVNANNVIDSSQIPFGTIPNGTAAAPSIAFTNSASTGFYSVSANVIGFTINGVETASLSATQFTLVTGVQLLTGAGSATAPAIAVGEQTGLYKVSTGTLGFTCAGSEIATLASGALNLLTGNVLQVAGTQVVGPQKTGWTIMTGTAERGTYATSSVTLAQLAGVVFALQQDLGTTAGGHGLINA